ncbi:MAG TPA: Npt1/Npt2 family nucleotide transporter [Candidatus Binatus sp.]|nr:Npt1/Npt2 family nucleotide transporter [Candidatus Binatus sp.]
MDRLSRGRDTRIAMLATLAAAAMMAEQVAGKATRDALFLTQFTAAALPKAMVAGSLLSFLGAILMARELPRLGPARVVPPLFAISAAFFVGEFVLALEVPRVAAVVLYLHMAVFGLLVISGFWSLVNERFDPHGARRAVGRIVAGTTLGGVLGGVLASRLGALVDLRAMFLALAVLHAFCAWAVGAVAVREREAAAPADDVAATQAWRILRDTPYLRQLAILVALSSSVSSLLDYALKAAAAVQYGKTNALVSFFAAFYTAIGVVTFLVQRLLAPSVLSRLGLGSALASLPAVVVLTGALGAAVSRLWAIVLLRGGEAVFSNSIYRTGLELLYTPLPVARKRASKAIIDIVSHRLGDLVAGGVLMVVVALAPLGAGRVVIGLAVGAAACALVIVGRLNRGYVAALAESLRRGVVSLEANAVVDATTARTLSETRVALDRDKLLAEIERYRMQQGADAPGAPEPASAEAEEPAFAQRLQALRRGDPDAVATALAEGPLDPRLVAYVIPLLGRGETTEAARHALAGVADRVPGQLTDALLDPTQLLALRTRLAPVLAASRNPRAVEGLVRGLTDPEFDVRFRCGQELARLKAAAPDAPIARDAVLAALQAEIEVGRAEWQERFLIEDDGTSVLLDPALHRRVNRSLEHVFTLLSLVVDPDAVRLSLQGLASGDPELRGTAIEYLENVVPEAVRARLWAHVGSTPSPRAGRRSRQDAEAELRRARGRR